MMTDKAGMTGVRGWLALLVIVIGVLTPLAQFGSLLAFYEATSSLSAMFGANFAVYRIGLVTIILARIILSLLVAYGLMYNKVAVTPRLAIGGIWIIYGLLGLLSVLLASGLGPNRFPIGIMAGRLAGPLLLCLIATAYLMRSKRVANTYGAPIPPDTTGV